MLDQGIFQDNASLEYKRYEGSNDQTDQRYKDSNDQTDQRHEGLV